MVTNDITTEQQNKYIEKFYDPKFSTYDFVSLFSALYAFEKKYSFNRDNLVEFINYCKQNSKFENLLSEINLKNNGASCYSEEFDEVIAKLKWGKILYTISPEQDSTIYIFENIPVEKLINPRSTYLEEANNFIREYNDFEFNKVSNTTLVKKKSKKNNKYNN